MQTAEIKWIGKQQFVGTSPSGHAMVMDGDRGTNVGVSPMEMLLMALAACTAVDVVIILEKKRQKLESLEISCSGEKATESPKVWTKLELVYRLRGEITDEAAKQAITLSEEKYCSVAAMLRKTAELTWRYEIVS